MSKKDNHTHGEHACTVCRCQKISTSTVATTEEKLKRYNQLASIAREALKDILIGYEKGWITTEHVTIEIYEDDHVAHILHDDVGYCVYWTKNGVVESRDGKFVRYVEFNDADAETHLQHCHCKGHSVDLLTLADVCKTIMERSSDFGISDYKVRGWKETTADCFKLSDLLKQAI